MLTHNTKYQVLQTQVVKTKTKVFHLGDKVLRF